MMPHEPAEPREVKKIRIAFVSIFYPVFMGRYLLEALRRRPDVELWTAGPYTGRWIPWAGGMNLPLSYVYKPDLATPLGMRPEVNYSMLEVASSRPWQPDLWLEVNAALSTVGRPKGKYAIIGTDPHVVSYDKERRQADFFFCMQKPYAKAGDIWLPYGYDPIWHSPTTIPVAQRQYDAALLGLQYAQREVLVRFLRAQGRNVIFELGPAYEDARTIYHDSRIGLNWSSALDTTARVFEVMAFGIAPVLNRVPDLMEMFRDGTDFIGFSNQDEAVSAVDDLMNDPEKCEVFGRAARRAVETGGHTWDNRVEQVLKATGLLS